MTVHQFQGFEAGFEVDDHINYIVADINNIAWEQKKNGNRVYCSQSSQDNWQGYERIPIPQGFQSIV